MTWNRPLSEYDERTAEPTGLCVTCGAKLDNPRGVDEDFCKQGCAEVWYRKQGEPLADPIAAPYSPPPTPLPYGYMGMRS